MINMILLILSLMLMGVIFLQSPKEDNLGTAFSNIYYTSVEKLLTKITFGIFVSLSLILILVR